MEKTTFVNDTIQPRWNAATDCGHFRPHRLVIFRDNDHRMGSVHPTTLSDLSPLNVKGSHLSHEDSAIVQQSGGRSTKAGSTNTGNPGQCRFYHLISRIWWVRLIWQHRRFWLTEKSHKPCSLLCQIRPCTFTLTLYIYQSVLFCAVMWWKVFKSSSDSLAEHVAQLRLQPNMEISCSRCSSIVF